VPSVSNARASFPKSLTGPGWHELRGERLRVDPRHLSAASNFSSKYNGFDADQWHSRGRSVNMAITCGVGRIVGQSIEALKEIALVNLRCAFLDVQPVGDREVFVSDVAPRHRDADACIRFF
jgi:hypothetical protein